MKKTHARAASSSASAVGKCLRMRIAGLVALFLPLAALASIPSLQDEEDKCATPLEVVGGSCVPYPADGICSAMFPAGTPIYLPANMSFALFESTLAGVIGTALNNRRAINSDSCLQHSLTFTCASRVYRASCRRRRFLGHSPRRSSMREFVHARRAAANPAVRELLRGLLDLVQRYARAVLPAGAEQ